MQDELIGAQRTRINTLEDKLKILIKKHDAAVKQLFAMSVACNLLLAKAGISDEEFSNAVSAEFAKNASRINGSQDGDTPSDSGREQPSVLDGEGDRDAQGSTDASPADSGDKDSSVAAYADSNPSQGGQ